MYRYQEVISTQSSHDVKLLIRYDKIGEVHFKWRGKFPVDLLEGSKSLTGSLVDYATFFNYVFKLLGNGDDLIINKETYNVFDGEYTKIRNMIMDVILPTDLTIETFNEISFPGQYFKFSDLFSRIVGSDDFLLPGIRVEVYIESSSRVAINYQLRNKIK